MATVTPGTRFLDPEALARIENLELLARTVVEGVTSGRHRSPYLGLSLDFAEHRAYMPGDDIRRIDWRLYARTDRYFVKQFEADTNANVLMLLDVSKSMDYKTGTLSKLDYGRFIAACLAYFCRHQGDRIGLMTFDDKVRENIPASARHLQLVLNTLERARAERAGGIAAPLRKLAEDLRRRSILVLVSDLYEEPEDIASAFGSLAAAGHDVIVFQVMDPAELEFPFDQATNFRDAESGDRMAVIPDELADEYRKLVLAHQAELGRLLTRNRIDYRAVSTSQPLDYVLFDFLSARERLTRGEVMPFSFLTPLFFIGAAALSIPLLIHLIQREKKQVIEFPSLMFLRKVPYQSVRRQRLKRLLLLLLRCAALLLLVAAFARPFMPNAKNATGTRSAREVVIMLDKSYSMGYGDRWARAQAAAKRTIGSLAGGDHASLVLFDTRADAVVRSSPEAARLNAALDGARPGAGATDYGPALKLAQSILAGSDIAQKELVVISDYQRAGWRDAERLELPSGTKVMPVAITDAKTENVAVTSVLLHPSDSTGAERVRVEARVANQSARGISALRVALALDGQTIQTRNVDVPANGAASVLFDPLATTATTVRATVTIPHDALTADDELHFVLTTEQSVPTLVIDGGQSGQPSLYLRRALAIGGEPRFRITQKSMGALTPSDFKGRALIVINDAAMPQGEVGRRLKGWVEDGGGLFVVAGPHATDAGSRDLLPGAVGSIVERTPERPGTIGWFDASNPIFEVFAAPRTGDFPAARIFHYRTLNVAQGAHVLARFDDGAPALVERQVGKGSVLEWTSTLDNDWSDMALQPVFLPFVQQVSRHLSGYGKSRPWHTVGELVDVSDVRSNEGVPQPLVSRSPSGARASLDAKSHAPVLPLDEAGFYEVRPARSTSRDALVIASNVDPTESDLSSFDPREMVSALPVRTDTNTRTRDTVAPPDQERSQDVWKYLLAAVLLLLVAETVFANRITRGPRAAVHAPEAT